MKHNFYATHASFSKKKNNSHKSERERQDTLCFHRRGVKFRNILYPDMNVQTFQRNPLPECMTSLHKRHKY